MHSLSICRLPVQAVLRTAKISQQQQQARGTEWGDPDIPLCGSQSVCHQVVQARLGRPLMPAVVPLQQHLLECGQLCWQPWCLDLQEACPVGCQGCSLLRQLQCSYMLTLQHHSSLLCQSQANAAAQSSTRFSSY